MINILYKSEIMEFDELGLEVAKIRREQKISQQQLANDLGISRATISSFENGRGIDIGIKKVLAIVDYIGLEITLRDKSPFPTLEELMNER